MTIVSKLKMLFTNTFSFPEKETELAKAYDIWANSYDEQPDNLMLALDEILFSSMLSAIQLTNKTIADVGCGTGRHWKKLFEGEPKKLVGFDISPGMIEVLKKKYPEAETYLLQNNLLTQLENESCEVLISTLTIAHIENLQEALNEWCRVLKPGGDILITDFHPAALARGGKRTFKYEGKSIVLKNYIHSVHELRNAATTLNLTEVNFEENIIDSNAKPYYEKQNALKFFEQVKGTSIIYGIHFTKKHGIA